MSVQSLKLEYLLENALKPVPEERMDTEAKINPEPCKQAQYLLLSAGSQFKANPPDPEPKYLNSYP